MSLKYIISLLCLLPSVSCYPQDNTAGRQSEVCAYYHVAQMPRPGYDVGEYLAKNIHVGDSKENLRGRIRVKFVVNEDGSISNSRILNAQGGAFEKEVLRVVDHMPPWEPGKQKGKPVKVYYVLPVNIDWE